MRRSTLHSSRRISVSARGPASAREPDTRGAAKGNSRVGTRAGLSTFFAPLTVAVCSEPTHSITESRSAKELKFAGTIHRAAWPRAWVRYSSL